MYWNEPYTFRVLIILTFRHPSPLASWADGGEVTAGVAGTKMLARQYMSAEYRGRNSHAGGNPWKGINSLDAFVSAYNNISLLRQQISPDERIHSVVLDSEKVINVIPAYAQAAYQTRSPKLQDLNVLTDKVENCIKAAGLATGCDCTIEKSVPRIL